MPINAKIRCFYAESAIWLVMGYKTALVLLYEAVDGFCYMYLLLRSGHNHFHTALRN